MADEVKADPARFAGHHVSDANDTAKIKGDGTRAALPAMPAGKRPMKRNIKVTVRAPFMPGHHCHARHGLSGHHKGHSKR